MLTSNLFSLFKILGCLELTCLDVIEVELNCQNY